MEVHANMDQIDIGLQHRIERLVRQIGSQHRSLGALYGDLTAAISKDAPARASDLYERYVEAVLAHFALEEACLFPACRGLNPEIARELHALCLEHEFFVEEMERLRKRVFEEQAADGEGALDAFYKAIAKHEEKEERLVRGIVAMGSANESSTEIQTFVSQN